MSKYWEKFEKLSSWRKISVGMWDTPRDPSIYGHETLNVEKAVDYLDEVSEVVGERVSMTALVVRTFADIFDRFPELNVILVNGQVQQRKSIDIFCQVAVPSEERGQADLSGVKIPDAPSLNLVEINRALKKRAGRVREGQDEDMERTKAMVDIVPAQVMKYMLKFVDFLTYNVPIDLDALGIRSDPFGSMMVSSIAQFDLKLGYAPLVSASRTPMVALPGKVHEAVLPVDGKPKVVKALTVGCTFDHRCYDGYQIGFIVRTAREMLTDPRAHLPAPETFAEVADSERTRRPEDTSRSRPATG